MKKKVLVIFVTILLLNSLIISQNKNREKSNQKEENVTFVSFPDFFNFDVPQPWPRWDKAVNYFLNQVEIEQPDFVAIAGDLVDGRWTDSPECIEQNGTLYYSDWKQRMKKHDLKYYTAIGDHELGDDPWKKDKLKLIPHFERVYDNLLDMPENGPEGKKGLAYYVRKGDLLFITVETFQVVGDSMRCSVFGEQLEWFKKVLQKHKDAKFKVVQGHIPIWGDPSARSSSKLMLDKGKDSKFYKTMTKYGTDLYLCGEFHDVTISESEGLWQIVHGASWGRKIVSTEDYLVANMENNNLNLEMKRIYKDASGGHMWNVNKPRGPREIVEINSKTLQNGPEIIGEITINKKNGKKKYLNRSGVFK